MSAQFQYFVVPKHTGKPNVLLSECAEYGLAYAFDEQNQPVSSRCSEGPRPDNNGGIVLCSSPARIGYYPDRQKWRAMHGNPDVWVGMEITTGDGEPVPPPAPADIARSKQADGELLTLGGQSWLIPRARQWEEHEGMVFPREVLPAPFDVNDQGQVIRGQTDERYRELWTLANAFHEAERSAEPGSTFSFDMTRFVNVAFQSNYRIGVSELLLLGVLYQEHFRQVADIVIDRERLEEFLKKNITSPRSRPTDDSFSSSSGVEQLTTEVGPDTDQPSPSLRRGHGESTETTTLSVGAN